MKRGEQYAELMRFFELLTYTERDGIVKLARSLAKGRGERKRIPASTPFRGYTECGDCGQHSMCYAKAGVPRCSACRRKRYLGEDE